jgi:hypothetical protein
MCFRNLFAKSQLPLNASREFPDHNNRSAVLVVHGMGAQKPYTTLDQFGRGLRQFFGPEKVQQQILFRPHPVNEITKENEWVQAFVRLTPIGADPKQPDQVIDLFEYYWAPVITDLVTMRQSLRFLLLSALTPFQYLRDNLILMEQLGRKAKQTNSGREGEVTAETPRIMPRDCESIPDTSVKRTTLVTALLILAREFARMLFIFLPLIAVIAGLYFLVAQPVISLIAPNIALGASSAASANSNPVSMLKFFSHWPLSYTDICWLLLVGLRLLYLGMCGLFLIEDFIPLSSGKSITRATSGVRGFMITLFLILLFGPWLRAHIPWLILEYGLLVTGALLLLGLVLFSSVFHDACLRAIQAVRQGWITALAAVILMGIALYGWRFAPDNWQYITSWILRWIIAPLSFVNGREVLSYVALAALLYFVRVFLTSAIGGLAVYLGADELSKNYAARALILDQCSEAVKDLLAEHEDLPSKKAPRKTYDRVLIAAHSLGSVISYDTLNRLLVQNEARTLGPTDLPRLKGMLTFGCPLNKVMYFFRTRTSRSTIILQRILFVLHPYRLLVRISNEANGPISLPDPHPATDPFGSLPEGFLWLNAYSPFDLISGKMFFYRADSNRRVEHGVMPWTAHLSYWENPDLYKYFGRLFYHDQ